MTAKTWNICPTHDPAFGGLYRSIQDFSRALAAPVLSFDDGRTNRSSLADAAVRIPAGTGILVRDCHRILRAAAEQAEAVVTGADLLIVHSLFRAHAPWAAALAHRRGKPFWAIPHGCLDPWSMRHHGLAKRLWLFTHGRACLRNAAKVIFSSTRARQKASRWTAGGNAVVVRWPVDLPTVSANGAARAAVREAFGIGHDASMLLLVGRLHTVKRPLATVQAFCTAAARNTHVVLVGMDAEITAAELLRAVPSSHAHRVHAVGEITGDRLADFYRAADGFVSLSFQENFGYAMAEALAHGLPVILSPGHDLAHELPFTAPGRLPCGWLLPDDSLTAAIQAITEWSRLAAGTVADRAVLRTMGAAGRAWVGNNLTRECFSDELRRLF